MRAAKIIILMLLVIFSALLLLYASRRAVSLSYISRLEKGEPGVVEEMKKEGLRGLLADYHIENIRTAGIELPNASASSSSDHPDAERFFYVDKSGKITIKGLSDENIPEDISQKCILFADSGLGWFQVRMLMEAFIYERMRTVYAAGLTPEGELAYVPFEAAAPGAFPMLYRYRICLLSDEDWFEFFEEEDEVVRFDGPAKFGEIAKTVKENSISENPFVRLVAMDKVSLGAAFDVLSMFEPAGLQAIVMLKTDDREYILARVEELSSLSEEKEEE